MVKSAFEELRDMVAHSTTVQSAAVELLRNLADRLNEIAEHPSAEDIRALSEDIRAHATELGTAIALHAEEEEEEGGTDEPDEPDDDSEPGETRRS